MEQSYSYKWVVILFFGVMGIISTILMVYLAGGNVAPDTYWGRKMTLPKSEDTGRLLSVDKHVLELNRGKQIGNRTFFFRGRQNDHIVFGVIIPEIDRQYPYPFKFSLPETQNGFEVAGIWFQLIALRSNFVSLKVMQ